MLVVERNRCIYRLEVSTGIVCTHSIISSERRDLHMCISILMVSDALAGWLSLYVV